MTAEFFFNVYLMVHTGYGSATCSGVFAKYAGGETAGKERLLCQPHYFVGQLVHSDRVEHLSKRT